MTNMFKIHIFIIMITNCCYDNDFLRGDGETSQLTLATVPLLLGLSAHAVL